MANKRERPDSLHARVNDKKDILRKINKRFGSSTCEWIFQWTVPQLSIMIIYNSIWSILIQ